MRWVNSLPLRFFFQNLFHPNVHGAVSHVCGPHVALRESLRIWQTARISARNTSEVIAENREVAQDPSTAGFIPR